jgi:hypothetical protein
MSDPTSAAHARLLALAQGRAPNADAFPPASRYHGLDITMWVAPDGSEYPYVRRRFLPSADRFALLHRHVVRHGERPDQIAAAELGDPEQFWLLADANNAMRPGFVCHINQPVRPGDLMEFGRAIRITLPADVPGPATGALDNA